MNDGQQDLIGFDSLKGLLLDIALERSLDNLLWMIVRRLAERPHIALARIWLIRPSDICAMCRMKPECPDQTECLHLVASAGRSSVSDNERWSELDGAFRRFPLGVRKVGAIAAKGEGIAITDINAHDEWFVRAGWIAAEGIHGFNGQPIVHNGKVMGVLAVFTRVVPSVDASFWIRVLADHAAAAIVNARSFEEIGKLRAQLELENSYLKEEVLKAHAFGDIIGESHSLQKALEQVALVAPTDASVLLLGESGTGK